MRAAAEANKKTLGEASTQATTLQKKEEVANVEIPDN